MARKSNAAAATNAPLTTGLRIGSPLGLAASTAADALSRKWLDQAHHRKGRCFFHPPSCYLGSKERAGSTRIRELRATPAALERSPVNGVRPAWYPDTSPPRMEDEPSVIQDIDGHQRRRGRRNRNTRVMHHLPLVRYVVRRLGPAGWGLKLNDLVSAGTIGLIEAADRYDPKRGVPFASFAYRRIGER